MFSLSELKQTRFYREAFEEGRKQVFEQAREEGARLEKLRIAPLMLKLGLSVEEVAEGLGLSVEEVTQVAP